MDAAKGSKKNKAVASTATGTAAVAVSKPKRPLSAFNLFYRFKREKVLQAVALGTPDHAMITDLVTSSPGLEHNSPDDVPPGASPDEVNALRRTNIRRELVNNLLPRDTRDRAHRTNQSAMNGAMSFLELGKLMNQSWKSCDDFAKGVFKELADEGREQYRVRLKEFNAHESLMKMVEVKSGSSSAVSTTQPNKKAKGKRPLKKRVSDAGMASKSASPVPSFSASDESSHPDVSLGDNINTSSAPLFAAALRTISSDDTAGASQLISARSSTMPLLPPPNNASVSAAPSDAAESSHLMARVKELEGQLATERLQARVRELEGELIRQRSVETNLRTELAMYVQQYGPRGPGSTNNSRPTSAGPVMTSTTTSSSSTAAAAAAAARGVVRPQDGLWSLVNASMIHPSVQATVEAERAALLSATLASKTLPAAAAQQQQQQQAMSSQPSTTKTSPTKKKAARRKSSDAQASPKKKPRCVSLKV